MLCQCDVMWLKSIEQNMYACMYQKQVYNNVLYQHRPNLYMPHNFCCESSSIRICMRFIFSDLFCRAIKTISSLLYALVYTKSRRMCKLCVYPYVYVCQFSSKHLFTHYQLCVEARSDRKFHLCTQYKIINGSRNVDNL